MQAVAAKFPTCLAALEFACESPGNQSLSVRAAWLAGWRLATPEIKAKQKEGMDRFFPEHRPDFYDSTGKGFMSLGALAKSLGKPVEDVEAMVKVLGDHGKSPVGELYRVN